VSPDPRAAFDVTGRVALITGGGRGLGRAMSTGLAAAGARVVAMGRTQSDLDETVAAIERDGGEAIGVRADVSDYDALPAVVAAAVERFGGLDILVNNAVDPSNGLIADLTPDVVERNFRTNVFGPMFLAQHAQPHLAASGHGSIVNVISVAVWVGTSGQAMYRGAKAALHGVTRVMAKEWAPEIRVNTIAPGPFETTARGGWTPMAAASAAAHTLMARMAPFEEIVPHVLYLASDASAFVTGQDLVVDGGITTGVPGDVLARTRAEFLARVEAGAGVDDFITRR
jgi:NAD(P)-dependent dehydrogenase (short-subunit alcohol dehydrogenase family)